MTISLPEPMKDWIEAQIRVGDFATPSDYVRDLVQRDREQRDAFSHLREAIEQAEASGVSSRELDEIFEAARATARERGLLGG